jgi:transcription termination factor NusB
MPIDLLAKAWAEHHSDRLVNGCLDEPAQRLQQYFG